MAGRTLSVFAIRINDELIEIVPNTFVYQGGEGETNVRASSAGSGNATSVHSEDAETQISMCKFEVYPTDEIDSKLRTWKRNVGINVIKATEGGGRLKPVVRVFPGMSLVNHPERNATADGTIELEFKGDQMTLG